MIKSMSNTASAPRWRQLWNGCAEHSARLVSDTSIALAARLGIAALFFQSGRTKVDGWLSVSDGALMLFREEYRLPLVDPTFAAHAAAWAEHVFPLLLVLGLATRLSAAALLGMTAVIQIFVYPDAWPTHLSWAALLLFLFARGGGRWSVDRLCGLR